MEQIVIEIPRIAPLLNEYVRMHFRQHAKLTATFAWEIVAALGRKPATPIEKCIVVIERYSTADPDWDGLYGSVKPILDAMVVATRTNPRGIGLIRNDDTSVIQSLQAVPCRAKPGKEKTVIRIFPLRKESGQ